MGWPSWFSEHPQGDTESEQTREAARPRGDSDVGQAQSQATDTPLVAQIRSARLSQKLTETWDDIIGLDEAKQV